MREGSAVLALRKASAVAALVGMALAAVAPAAAQEVGSVGLNEGPRIYGQCIGCHQIGPGARHTSRGPHLNGVFGRRAGSIEGFYFSRALLRSGIVWDEETVAAYIENPSALVPGTSMRYFGLRGPLADRRIGELISFLQGFGPDGAPATPLDAPPAAPAEPQASQPAAP